jgi:hypothetical protein
VSISAGLVRLDGEGERPTNFLNLEGDYRAIPADDP